MGSIGSALGGIAGTAIGGPVGGQIGSALGGFAGSSLGGGGGGGGSTTFGGSPIPLFSFGGVFNPSNTSRFKLKTLPRRQELISQLGASFGQQAEALRGFLPGIQEFFGQGLGATEELLGQVRPGFGALTEARVSEILNRGSASRSNLRSNLARRRVLGSSFAEDVLGRFDQQLAQDVGQAKAVSFLEELDATNQLINQRLQFNVQNVDLQRDFLSQAFAAERGATQVELDEQNLLLQTGLSLLDKQADILSSNAQLEAQLAAQGAQQAGFGAGFGGGGGGLLSSIFGGGSGGQTFGSDAAFGFLSGLQEPGGGLSAAFGNLLGGASGAFGPGF